MTTSTSPSPTSALPSSCICFSHILSGLFRPDDPDTRGERTPLWLAEHSVFARFHYIIHRRRIRTACRVFHHAAQPIICSAKMKLPLQARAEADVVRKAPRSGIPYGLLRRV